MHTKSGNNVRNNPAGHTGTTYVFEGRTPLHLVSGVCLFEEKDTIVVPKGCKKEYQENGEVISAGYIIKFRGKKNEIL